MSVKAKNIKPSFHNFIAPTPKFFPSSHFGSKENIGVENSRNREINSSSRVTNRRHASVFFFGWLLKAALIISPFPLNALYPPSVCQAKEAVQEECSNAKLKRSALLTGIGTTAPIPLVLSGVSISISGLQARLSKK